jgi:MFS family permease
LNSYITDMRGGWTVQRAVTFVTAAMYLGTAAGPLFGGWVGTNMGLSSVFRISAVIFLISTGMILFARKPFSAHDPLRSQTPAAIRTILPFAGPIRDPRFVRLMVLLFFSAFALYLPQPLTPVYLGTEHKLTLQQIGLTGTMASIGNTLIMLVLGGLKAPTGMVIGQGLGAVFCVFLLLGQNTAAFAVGYLFVGGQRLFRSMALASAAALAPRGETGLAFGMLETVSALVVIAAPAAAGFLYNYHPQAVYTASLAGIGIMIVLNMLLMPNNEQTVHKLPQTD